MMVSSILLALVLPTEKASLSDEATSFNTIDIWILNVGDMKLLELPMEYYLNLAYDSPRWPLTGLTPFFQAYAAREFGAGCAGKVADIMGLYSMHEPCAFHNRYRNTCHGSRQSCFIRPSSHWSITTSMLFLLDGPVLMLISTEQIPSMQTGCL